MSDIAITTDYEIDIQGGELRLTEGLDSIRQNLKQRLSMFFGEWFLDKSKGLPYYQHIFVKNPNPVVVDAAIKKEVFETPGILEIQNFVLDLDTATRVLSVTLKARTDEGLLEFAEDFGVGG